MILEGNKKNIVLFISIFYITETMKGQIKKFIVSHLSLYVHKFKI